MPRLTEPQLRLLAHLALEGKATRLESVGLRAAKQLAEIGLVFLIGKAEPFEAVIMPKGRNPLAELGDTLAKSAKPPVDYLK